MNVSCVTPLNGGVSPTKYSSQSKNTVSTYYVPGNIGKASYVHSQPSERETRTQRAGSATRLPREH